jgi:hypothetical protein
MFDIIPIWLDNPLHVRLQLIAIILLGSTAESPTQYRTTSSSGYSSLNRLINSRQEPQKSDLLTAMTV